MAWTGRAMLRPAGFVCALLVALLVAHVACAEDVTRTIAVGAVERSYHLHIPPSLPSGAAALVIDLHGGGGSPEGAEAQTGFTAEADAKGFVVAYPAGSDRERPLLSALGKPGLLTWNAGACCGYAVQHGMDDVGFIRAMVADIAGIVPVDPKRIYATGISNGGMMAYRLACDASDLLAAVGVVSGVVVVVPCEPRFPVAVIDFHGTADQNVPIGGGVGPKSITRYPYPPVARSIEFWAAYDDCRKDPIVSRPAPGVTLNSYPLCVGNAAVDYYVIDGGGHSWPSGKQMLKVLDPPSQAIAATPLIWQFFAAHPKP
ncbi:MAG TPA: PHB depolymerase family esterase [Candidatus Binatia bacterium]|nr:PHB depolymerase family esterase [Candidatus Binatia bacterium]